MSIVHFHWKTICKGLDKFTENFFWNWSFLYFYFVTDTKHVEEAEKRKAKEKELAKVSIKKEDVDLIVEEMEISKTLAERTLREHAGNVVEALASLTN